MLDFFKWTCLKYYAFFFHWTSSRIFSSLSTMTYTRRLFLTQNYFKCLKERNDFSKMPRRYIRTVIAKGVVLVDSSFCKVDGSAHCNLNPKSTKISTDLSLILECLSVIISTNKIGMLFGIFLLDYQWKTAFPFKGYVELNSSGNAFEEVQRPQSSIRPMPPAFLL